MAKSLAEITAELSRGVKTVLVDAADVSFVTPPRFNLGNLDTATQQTMMAQRVKSVAQSSADFTTARGIGLLGLNMQQLADAGLIDANIFPSLAGENTTDNAEGVGLVPITLALNPQACYDALVRGTVWTGAYGVTNISLLLGNAALQLQILQDLYIRAYQQLLSTAVLTPASLPAEISLCVGLASIYGVDATAAFLRSKR